MNLALALLSVVALSTAAPQNYTSHFQIFHFSTTDPTLSSTNTTTDADGVDTAANSTYDAADTPSYVTTSAADDVISDTTEVISGSAYSTNSGTYTTVTTEGTTTVINATTQETNIATETTFTDGSSATPDIKFRISGFKYSTDGGTTSSSDGDTSSTDNATGTTDGAKNTAVGRAVFTIDDPDVTHVLSNSTVGVPRTVGASNETGSVRNPSIGARARSDVTRETAESTTEVFSETTTEEAYDKSSTNASIKSEGGVRMTAITPTDHNWTINQGHLSKNGSGEVEDPGFGFTFKLPSFFATILQTVSTIGSASSNTTHSDKSIIVNPNGGSNLNSSAQRLHGVLVNDSTTATTTISPNVIVSGNSFGTSGA